MGFNKQAVLLSFAVALSVIVAAALVYGQATGPYSREVPNPQQPPISSSAPNAPPDTNQTAVSTPGVFVSALLKVDRVHETAEIKFAEKRALYQPVSPSLLAAYPSLAGALEEEDKVYEAEKDVNPLVGTQTLATRVDLTEDEAKGLISGWASILYVDPDNPRVFGGHAYSFYLARILIDNRFYIVSISTDYRQ